MSNAKKCELCGGYYDRERFIIEVTGPGGHSRGADCCSVACAGAYAERETARLAGWLRTLAGSSHPGETP